MFPDSHESAATLSLSDSTTAHHADLVVVGSGVAGLSAALAGAEAGARVVMLTAGDTLSGSSPCAQGGVAAALGANDSPALHMADTCQVGAGLNDRGAVRALIHDGRDVVGALLAAGVPFAGSPAQPELGLEAGHARRRILHAGGGATGRVLTMALLDRAAAHPRITICDHTPADALVSSGARVAGVRSGAAVYYGRAVVLATGGYAALWERTTNRPESRGTGLALAWWAGASLADLEFVQFHPTALALPGRPAYLLSEALRGEGAHVVDGDGRPIVDPLLPRDVVARAIARHLYEHGPAYLSLRHLEAGDVRAHFPAIATQLAAWGLDLARDLLPIAPAAHYCMGGVRSDVDGRSDRPGLYVAGEVACTGAQGANRLASNSLLECLVFGRRAAHTALHDDPARHAHWDTQALTSHQTEQFETARTLSHHRPQSPRAGDGRNQRLGHLLDRYLGVERDGAGLATLRAMLPDPETDEVSAPYVVAALAARAAALRAESRGAHYRGDAPRTRRTWRGRMHWRRGQQPHFERIVS